MSVKEICHVGLWAVEVRVGAHCGDPAYLSTHYFAADSAHAAMAFSEHEYSHYPVNAVRKIGTVSIYTELPR